MSRDKLVPFAPGVWTSEAPVRFLGLHLSATMTVLRLHDESLLLHSPVSWTAERQRSIDALGSVRYVYSPNTFHHLRIGDWSNAYPHAAVRTSPGLRHKRADLRIDSVHGDSNTPLDNFIEEHPIRGFRLEETVLYYRPARVLIVTDLVHNIGAPTHWWTKMYSTLAGFYNRVALSRVIRWTAFTDKAAARASIETILQLPFESVIVGHGQPIRRHAREVLAQAYAWLV